MTGRREVLRSLEVAQARASWARQQSDYRAAIERTNVTGLASLRDYQSVLGASVQETREWLCAQMPLIAATERVGGSVSGVLAVAIYPPDQPLPKVLRRDLEQLEQVATATGTQVLEARNASDSLAAACSVSGRQECAIAYLVVGDVEGNRIRRLIWQLHGSDWQLSPTVLELAAARGLSRLEYESLQAVLTPHLPPADDRRVMAVVHAQDGAASTRKSQTGQPWITFADTAELIE